jgi:hypothetical protein
MLTRSAALVAALILAACHEPAPLPATPGPVPASPVPASPSPASPSAAVSAAAPAPVDAGAPAASALPDACARRAAGDDIDAPVPREGKALAPATIKAALVKKLGWTTRNGLSLCGYELHGHEPQRVYVWALCEEFVAGDGGAPAVVSGVSIPAVLDLDAAGEPVAVRTPGDGSQYGRDVQAMFPRAVAAKLQSAGRGRLTEALRAEAACRLAAAAR